jgi:putative oxygen-independent coproporphyrinogen III oxidase
MQSQIAESIAIFVFVPFCRIKCTYCDFNVYANLSRVMEPYANAVAREIQNSKFNIGKSTLGSIGAKSIYFGGGTPSIVPTAQIEKMMLTTRKVFEVASDAEITLEANPGTMDATKLADLRGLGINRLSIGVQSFDDVVLKRLNRGHTVADALKTYDDARRAGFENMNLDFIFGLPLQTMDDWRMTLEQALALRPEHLSLYALKVEEGTGLKYQIERGKYAMPEDEIAADMYTLAEEKLEEAGYEHYEISNWARRVPATHESPLRSAHNLTYWLNRPYLGFGAGAHSYFGGARYWNVLSPLEYVDHVQRGESAIGGREEIGRELEMAETMILGLRLERGVVFEGYQNRFGEDVRKKYAAQLREMSELGLIEWLDGVVRLTPRGRLLSNEVFWRFLP